MAAAANAQNSQPEIDVVGLRLGMTLADAKAQLAKYKPGIWMVTTYATEGSGATFAGGLGMAPQEHGLQSAKVRVPTGIFAGYIDKAYVEKPKLSLLENPDGRVQQFSGEFFRLAFSPVVEGGKLYSIVRHRIYASNDVQPLNVYAEAGIELPRVSDVEKGVLEKYGNPADKGKVPYVGAPMRVQGFNTGWNLAKQLALSGALWIYDRKGKRLASNDRDFTGCESAFMNGVLSTRPLYSVWKHDDVTLRELQDSFLDADYSKRPPLGRSDPGQNVSNLERLIPVLLSNQANKYKGCGTQLQVMITMGGAYTDFAGSLTISLTDQDALFFDNGVADFLKAQIAKISNVPPAAPKKKEVF